GCRSRAVPTPASRLAPSRSSSWRTSMLAKWRNVRIRGRLIAGFTAVCAVLAAAVGFAVTEVRGIAGTSERMIELRSPVAIASTEMVGHLYATLAALRGYLLTGSPQGKADRANAWSEFDATIANFDALAARFTDPRNKDDWARAKSIIAEF